MALRVYPTLLAAVAVAAGLSLTTVALSRAAGGPSPRAADASVAVAEPVLASRLEQRTFYSAALDRTMPYSLYLPSGYAAAPATERYPVLYLLHGRGDSHQSWLEYGLHTEADRLIAAGVIPPLLIVMPEGEAGYWSDHVGTGPRWGTYVGVDLVAEIDASLRTVRGRDGRAIGGISMGGHGALQLALRHPDTFSIVGAHSVALRAQDIAPAFLGAAEAFAERDPVALYARHHDVATSLQLWLDIGADDPWLPATARFHSQLIGHTIAHRWTVWPGGHDATYWRAHMPDYLTYYGLALMTPPPAVAVPASSMPPARSGH